MRLWPHPAASPANSTRMGFRSHATFQRHTGSRPVAAVTHSRHASCVQASAKRVLRAPEHVGIRDHVHARGRPLSPAPPVVEAPDRAPRAAPRMRRASSAARRSSSSGSPIPRARLAATVTSFSPPSFSDPARSSYTAQPAERDEQIEAGVAMQAGQRQALEHPLKAALRASTLGSPVNAAACEPARRAQAR